MKLHSAAAMALVVWYLMLPPSKGSPTFVFDAQAPFKQWIVRDTFDTASECRESAKVSANLFKAFADKEGTAAAINVSSVSTWRPA